MTLHLVSPSSRADPAQVAEQLLDSLQDAALPPSLRIEAAQAYALLAAVDALVTTREKIPSGDGRPGSQLSANLPPGLVGGSRAHAHTRESLARLRQASSAG